MPTTRPCEVAIRGESIDLGGFLKCAGAVGTGGAAKVLIQHGAVAVNGQTETRRRHHVRPGDVIALADGRTFLVAGGS